jgi:hypothetical protein
VDTARHLEVVGHCEAVRSSESFEERPCQGAAPHSRGASVERLRRPNQEDGCIANMVDHVVRD